MSSLQVNADGWMVVVKADGSLFQDGTSKSKQSQAQAQAQAQAPMLLLDGTRTFLQLLQPPTKQKEKHKKGLKQQETAPTQSTGSNGDSSPPGETNATTDPEAPAAELIINKEQNEPHDEKEAKEESLKSNDNNNDTSSKEKVSSNANPRATDPEAQELARLFRVKLYDPALQALTEIERMSVNSRDKEQHGTDDSTATTNKKTGQTSKRRSLSRNEIRLQQLEREQKARNEKDNNGE
eukprot:scaffold19798_cov51-Attheya_sp.AAC.1